MPETSGTDVPKDYSQYERDVHFYNSKGEKIVGTMSEISKHREEITLIVHGVASNKEAGSENIGNHLTESGINSFRFDLYDTGRSEPEFKSATVVSTLDTISSAFDFAKGKGYSSFNVVASCSGVFFTMIEVLSRRENISKLVLRAPVINLYEQFEKLMEKKEFLTFKKKGSFPYRNHKGQVYWKDMDCMEESKNYDILKSVHEVTCPVLIMHGTEDKVIDYHSSEQLVERLPNGILEPIEGAGHNLGVNGDFSESLRLTGEFLSK